MAITPATVVSKNETTCFTIALVLAIIFWLALTICTLGSIVFGLAFGFFAIWLSNGLLVAGLRSEAVEVHADQLGRLHAALREVNEKLAPGSTTPELYVLQSGGLLNAFATRHAGRHFVVIYSDMLEALGPDSNEMKFLLGHEIGHIRRKHLGRRLLLAPALFLPILGPAYSRACESTCDRFGAPRRRRRARSRPGNDDPRRRQGSRPRDGHPSLRRAEQIPPRLFRLMV